MFHKKLGILLFIKKQVLIFCISAWFVGNTWSYIQYYDRKSLNFVLKQLSKVIDKRMGGDSHVETYVVNDWSDGTDIFEVIGTDFINTRRNLTISINKCLVQAKKTIKNIWFLIKSPNN